MELMKLGLPGDKRMVQYRQIFVLIQLTAGIVLIISASVIFLQLRYTQNKDLGFNDENVIYSYSPMTMNLRPDKNEKLSLFRNELAGIPEVEQFCVSSSIPGQPFLFTDVRVKHTSSTSEREIYAQQVHVDPYYFDLYRIALVGGRNFRTDEFYPIEEVVLNRKAAESLGFTSPGEAVGQVVRTGQKSFQIIGMVENYHHFSLKDELQPIVFFKSLKWRGEVGFYSFRLTSMSNRNADRISEAWSNVYPLEQFLYKSIKSSYQEQYQAEISFGRSVLIAALLAIVISCLGLTGLSSYNALKRTREIGIRKVFGSTGFQVILLMQQNFIFLVGSASLVGIPLAILMVKRWLNNFAFRITIAWWIPVIAFFIVLLASLSTTLIQTIKASRKNPADTLRYE